MRGIGESVVAALADAGIGEDAAVLVAVSGGPDSTCLLHALADLQCRRIKSLRACIVDHGIRGPEEIEEEIAFVRRMCETRGVALTIARVPRGECAARAREARRSLEETARECRHRLLRDVARREGAELIALGHTQDDVLETLLMRVIQGSGADGLGGIPARRGPFVRPLLTCTRAQVRAYLRERNLGWREDSSNRDTRFLRNRVRSALMPVLERDFPGYRAGLLTMSRKLASVAEMVHAQSARIAWADAVGGFSVDAAAFFAAPPALRASSLLTLYDRFREPHSPRRLPWRFLAPSLRSVARPRGEILRGYGAVLRVDGDVLFWGRDLASRGKKGYFIEVSGAGYAALPEGGMHLTFARCTGNVGGGTGGVSLRSTEVQPPVFVRSKRLGDEILLEGGMTSVKDLLAGWKVPVGDRDKIPLLADRKGVLAILGGALGYRTRVRAGALAEGSGSADRIDVGIVKDMEEAREQQR